MDGIFNIRRMEWDFNRVGWWSRPYEYSLIEEVCKSYFNDEIGTKIALDFGCGPSHPGIFFLEKLGFKKVYGCDLFQEHKLLKKYKSTKIEYFKDCLSMKNMKFDLITSISVLEHMDETIQELILTNLISQLNENGVFILTFDMPGFEYKTNLDLYKSIFTKFKISYEEEFIDDVKIMNNKNSVVRYEKGWPEMNIDKLSCYRLIGYKINK